MNPVPCPPKRAFLPSFIPKLTLTIYESINGAKDDAMKDAMTQTTKEQKVDWELRAIVRNTSDSVIHNIIIIDYG